MNGKERSIKYRFWSDFFFGGANGKKCGAGNFFSPFEFVRSILETLGDYVFIPGRDFLIFSFSFSQCFHP